jgi:hypothetical protein
MGTGFLESSAPPIHERQSRLARPEPRWSLGDGAPLPQQASTAAGRSDVLDVG